MMIRRSAIVVALLALIAALAVPALASGASTEAKVTVGSPTTPYLPNGSNEPALAMDANHPAMLAAGANDLVDSAPCQGSNCNLTPDIGISRFFFPSDGAPRGPPPPHPARTPQRAPPPGAPPPPRPGSFEHGMPPPGAPALTFGPNPGPTGFSWSNGPRLYYANLAF